ncbi:Hint domain-containing protein [Paracoccus aminophilus]|uniref:Hedgehog/Intein (Hint) domain-containing protein n=1 Tax=Paracoccus aminophilus JCM 7686 TaxID=1367847 RepID=S5YEF6_PARAH|nr:Hint domain-containing protein [Paracoccus aminophilus]AGT09873.1 hypothetical protein JCM7686_2817 [Paracoccus aminophilus JCM 7686]
MPTYIVNQLYFGKFQDLDPVEASGTGANIINQTNELSEVPGWGAGVRFGTNALKLLSVTQNDTVREGRTDRLEENDFVNRHSSQGGPMAADTITYNAGSGKVTSALDSTFRWRIEVELFNGTKIMRDATFIQLEDGAILSNFLPSDFQGLQIRAITLVSYLGSNFFGTAPNRSLNNVTVVCFSEEAAIATLDGERRAGDLKVGDTVMTQDHGGQRVRWIHENKLDAGEGAIPERLQPIRIAAGALGQGLPKRDLMVSPQHRMLIRSRIAARMFGASEVLVPAKHLLPHPGIERVEVSRFRYIHFALSRHEIVFAEGAPTESIYPGKVALASMDKEPREELTALFATEGEIGAEPVRPFLKAGEVQRLLTRHHKNRRALLAEH